MEFNLSFNKTAIKKDETAKVVFEFVSETLAHCVSYQFLTYFEDTLLRTWMPHEFVHDVNGTFKNEFNEVLLSEYFGDLAKEGVYNLTVRIKYLVCGQAKAETVDGKASIYID